MNKETIKSGYNKRMPTKKSAFFQKVFRATCLVTLFLLGQFNPVFALTTPGTITFQATVANNDGLLNTNDGVVEIKIVSGAQNRVGLNPWSEKYSNVLIVNGTFSIILGSKKPITANNLSVSDPHFMITVNGNTGFFKIPSVPYAIQAKIAEQALSVDASDITGTFTNPVNIDNDLVVQSDVLVADVSTGRVGIGTANPSFTLDVSGNINANAYFINGVDLESALSWQQDEDGNLSYANGNVGIGTANPTSTLAVVGTINATEYTVDGVPIRQYLGAAAAWEFTPNLQDIFFDGGTNILSGDPIGNVGIGTASPSVRLDVNGAIRIGNTRQGRDGTIRYTGTDFEGFVVNEWISLSGIQGSGESNQIVIWDGPNSVTGSNNLVWNLSNERLGIGTTNPTAQLTIVATSNTSPMMQISDTAGNTIFQITSQSVSIGTSNTEHLLSVGGEVNAENYLLNGQPIQDALRTTSFWIEQNDNRIFYDAGFVGIGTRTPRNLLELSGTGNRNPVITFDVDDVDLFSIGVDVNRPDVFIISNGSNLNDPLFSFNGEKIGIGLSEPSANLEVSGNNGVLFTGQFDNGVALEASGEGSKLIWHPGKAAFRAGYVFNDEWDEENIGTYSVAFGLAPTASGIGSVVAGGRKNGAAGDYSAVLGGFENSASRDYTFAAGHKAYAKTRGSFVWADYSPDDPAFESSEQNQFLILASGGVGINTNETLGNALTVSKNTETGYLLRAHGNADGENAIAITTSGNVGIGTLNPGNNKLAVVSGSVGIGTTNGTATLTVVPANNDTMSFVAYREDGNPAIFVRRDGKIGIGHELDFAFPNDTTIAVAGTFGSTTFKQVDPNDPDASIIIGSNPGSPWSVPSQNNNNTFFNRGSVGIGTATPNSLLTLSSTGNRDAHLTFDQNNSDLYTLGVSRNMFTIQPSSNLNSANPPIQISEEGVGIALQYQTPSASLHVGGSSILFGNVAVGTSNVNSIYKLLVDGRLNVVTLNISGQDFLPMETPWETNLANSNIFFNGGNVGIGTNSPTTKLEVIGTVSANQIIHNDQLTLNGILRAHEVKIKDTNAATFGSLKIIDEDLVYTNASGIPKILSTNLQRDLTPGPGYLGYWSNDTTIGVSGIYWNNADRSLNVSGNLDFISQFSESSGISVTNNIKIGSPKAISIVSTINHGGDSRSVKSYTGEEIKLNIARDWGNINQEVAVKGLDITLLQEDDTLILNRARVTGLHIDVSSVNIDTTSAGSGKAAAVFIGGNVGVGTLRPSTALEVNGTVSANFFNLSGGLFVPELYVANNGLVAFKNDSNQTRVGIGTNTPRSELDVVGTISANSLSLNGGIQTTTLNVNDGTLFVNSEGLIGIGTTDPSGHIEVSQVLSSSTSTPYIGQKLNVLIDGAGPDQTFAFNQDITGVDISLEGNVSNQIANGKKAIGLDIDTSGLELANGNTVVGLQIDVSGNTGSRYAAIFNGRVGIGTDTPQADLHVNGNVLANNLFLEGTLESESATFNQLIVNTFARFDGTVSINTLEVTGTLNARSLVLGTGLEAQFANFATINALSASINGLTKVKDLIVSQNFTAQSGVFNRGVGINRPAPTTGLAVSGDIYATNIEAVNQLSLTSGTINIQNGTLFINQQKKVGIGTSSPKNTLHVVSRGSSPFLETDTNTWNGIRIQNNSNTVGSTAGILLIPDNDVASDNIGSAILAQRVTDIDNNHGSKLLFNTDPTTSGPRTRMVIDENGNVGVGTTTPTSKLHVVGNTLIEGQTTINILNLSTINSGSTLNIRTSEGLIVNGIISSNALIQHNSGMVFIATSNLTAQAGKGILYTSLDTNDLIFKQANGTEINISQPLTGTANFIPYFNDNGGLESNAPLQWIEDSDKLLIGNDTSITSVEILSTLNNSYLSSFNAQTIVLGFGARTTASDAIFKGLDINFIGQTPSDPNNFGRLAQNETAIGIEVDLTTLAAGRTTAQSSGATLSGKKYAAIFQGGNVGIGVADPEAALHVSNAIDRTLVPFRIDTRQFDNTVINNAFVVSQNAKVGIGTANPQAKLSVVAVADQNIATASRRILNVYDINDVSVFSVDNNGKVAIGQASASTALDIAGTLNATVASFNSIQAVTLNISNGSLFVNQAGEVGFGTTSPNGSLNFSKSITPTDIPASGFTSQKMSLGINGGNENLVFNLNRDLIGMNVIITSNASSRLSGTAKATGYKIDLSELTKTSSSKVVGLDVDVTGTNATRYAAIFKGGKVGIGVAEPTAELHVSGNIKTTSIDITGSLDADHITANSLTVAGDAIFNGTITTNRVNAATISANNITLSGTFSVSTASITTLNTTVATFNRLGIALAGLPVANLDVSGNASFLNGRVGIGTTAPQAALHVSSNGTVSPFRVQVPNSVNVNGDFAFIVSRNGAVSIGTSNASAAFNLTRSDNTLNYLDIQDSARDSIFHIDKNGLIGVNTRNINASFEVVGSDNTIDILKISSAANTPPILQINNAGQFGINATTFDAAIVISSNGTVPADILLNVGNATHRNTLVVDKNGQVGIRTTPATDYGLTVSGSIVLKPADGSLQFVPPYITDPENLTLTAMHSNIFSSFGLRKNASDNYETIIAWGNGSHDDLFFKDQNGNNEMILTGDGRLGIGINPQAQLHVTGNTPLIIDATDKANAFTINSSGEIGIGTSNPQADFHVDGSLMVKELIVNQDSVNITTLNVSKHISVITTVNNNAATGQLLDINLGADSSGQLIGLDIDVESLQNTDLGRKFSLFNTTAYGIRVNMTDLEVEAASLDSNENGNKYAAAFIGGYVGVGTNLPQAPLHVVGDPQQNIARFGSAEGDLTIKDQGAGGFAFNIRDLSSGSSAIHQPLILAKDKVGIGINPINDNEPEDLVKLVVNGDVRVGVKTVGSQVGTSVNGNRIHFSGGPNLGTTDNDNNSPLWIGRHNAAINSSELRVAVGNGDGLDRFIIGADNAGAAFLPIFQVIPGSGNIKSKVGIQDGSVTNFDPNATLHIKGTTAGSSREPENHLVVLENSGGDTADSLVIWHTNYTAIDQVPTHSNFIVFGDASRSLGEIEGNGAGGVRFKTNGADYAEYLKRTHIDEVIKKGDIVGVRNGEITLNTEDAQYLLVRSSAASIAGNWPGENEEKNYELIAFFGQVQVNVIGPVEKGDYILASNKHDGTGIAIKPKDIGANEYDKIVGQAWESNNKSEKKQILAAVGFNFSTPKFSKEVNEIKTLQSEIELLKTEQNELDTEFMKKLEEQDNQIKKIMEKLSMK